ncbi:MAG TPA: nucleotide exchange factor GrpE [Vicinamibacteria bacterium]|nr:nucleotide exchange factor GrpE [Vicinamibacteria bacterium]
MAEDRPFPDPDDDPAAGPDVPEASPAAPAPADEPSDPGRADAYEGRTRLAEERLAEVLAAYRKVKTDNEAFRDRTTRNLERRFDQRRESLLLKFIDILDNMDRALESAQTAYVDQSLLEGLILVRTQLLQTLQDEGLDRIPVLGLPYDPHVSEAVGAEAVDDPDQNGIVLKELMRGYRLNGRVARASRVVIAEYRVEGAARSASAASEPGAAEGAATGPAPGEGEVADGELTLEEIIARTEDEPGEG